MFFYAARQPILDRNKKLFAYELLFRDSLNNVFPDICSDEATTNMIEASKLHMGLRDFTGNKPAFINFTLETLTKDYFETLLPQEVVVEILETEAPCDQLFDICKALHKKGYTIALDDYIHQPGWQRFYPYIKIIKIDWKDTSIETINELKSTLTKHPHIQLLAEKVETYAEYNLAFDLGFELFQGFFFAKPEMVKTKNLSPSQLAVTYLLNEVIKPELNFDSITNYVEQDLTLSYKILRYVNSPFFNRMNKISSIKQAVVSLGTSDLKRFLALMFAANINPTKPLELIRAAMVRAKFCELVSQTLNQRTDPSIAFLTGMLSLIDAILDENLKDILAKLPLSQEIENSLLAKKGPIASILLLEELIGYAEWRKAYFVIEKMQLKKDDVIYCYNSSLIWADKSLFFNS